MKLRSLLIGVMLVIVVVVPAYAAFAHTFATVTQNATLYKGPATNYAIAGTAKAGQVVLLVDQSTDKKWYQLATGDWIDGAYISTQPATSLPTATPSPTNTPIPGLIQEWVGFGDSVEQLPKIDKIAILVISGGLRSEYFGVKGYDAQGDYQQLLVNTTGPYIGTVPIGLEETTPLSLLEIKASGVWHIYLFEAAAMRTLRSGSITGKGDDVFALLEPHAKLAEIDGNAADDYFGVKLYRVGAIKHLVNTSDPYHGTVIVGNDFAIVVVRAKGPWAFTLK